MPESRYHWTTTQAAYNVHLATPLNAGCRGKCVFAHFSTQVSDHCDSGQNKTHTFSKREQKYFSAYHKHPALMQPVFKAVVLTRCHTGRGLAGHPRCVRVGNDYGKMRFYSPICSKTTAQVLHADESAGKSSHRNYSSSPERVRILQPLLPRQPNKTVACDLF